MRSSRLWEPEGWTPHSWSRGNLLCALVKVRSLRRVVEGLIPKHGDGDGENAVHDTSQGSGVVVALGTKPVVVVFEVRVCEDGDACPMMESIVEGQRASSSHEDLRSLLATLTAFFGDGSYAAEASKGIEISETNGVVGVTEHGSEHDGADTG